MKQTHYELFGLAASFAIDLTQLDRAYRDLQARIHPDKFAGGTPSEKRIAMQWATAANEAYITLKQPIDRARYLLSLHGVDTQEESNTSMPTDFLMQQMQWREAAEDAVDDAVQLEALLNDFSAERREMLTQLSTCFDRQEYTVAAGVVRKLRFIEKLEQEIGDALAVLEN